MRLDSHDGCDVDEERRSGPRLVVDLDAGGRRALEGAGDVAVIYQRRLWLRESPGCLTCAGEGGGDLTLYRESATGGRWVCLEHGRLAPVKYRATRQVEIRIGPVVRRGTERVEDILLLPASMRRAERRRTLEALLEEVEAEERETGALPE